MISAKLFSDTDKKYEYNHNIFKVKLICTKYLSIAKWFDYFCQDKIDWM